MLLKSKVSTAKYRFLFVANIVILSELINHYLKGNKIFSDSWLCSAFGFLLAYIFYMLFLEDFILKSTSTIKFSQQVTDLLRLTCLFFISKLITNYIDNDKIDSIWVIRTLMIIGSYFISDISFIDYLIKFNNHQLLLYNILQRFFAEYLIILFLYSQYTITDFINSISFLISYIIFETITIKFINTS